MTTATPYQPRKGDIGLTQISGEVGKLIEIGQWCCGDGFKDFEHAFVYTGDTDLHPNGMIVEAEPGGARYVPNHYLNVYWCQGLSYGLTDAQREDIAQAAFHYIGRPYSFLDYLALAAKHTHLPDKLVENYVAATGHMICSQLAAACYWDALVPIFPGSWTGDVMPLDLYRRDVYLRAKNALAA